MYPQLTSPLQGILDNSIDHEKIFGAMVKIESGADSFSWEWGAGKI